MPKLTIITGGVGSGKSQEAGKLRLASPGSIVIDEAENSSWIIGERLKAGYDVIAVYGVGVEVNHIDMDRANSINECQKAMEAYDSARSKGATVQKTTEGIKKGDRVRAYNPGTGDEATFTVDLSTAYYLDNSAGDLTLRVDEGWEFEKLITLPKGDNAVIGHPTNKNYTPLVRKGEHVWCFPGEKAGYNDRYAEGLMKERGYEVLYEGIED